MPLKTFILHHLMSFCLDLCSLCIKISLIGFKIGHFYGCILDSLPAELILLQSSIWACTRKIYIIIPTSIFTMQNLMFFDPWTWEFLLYCVVCRNESCVTPKSQFSQPGKGNFAKTQSMYIKYMHSLLSLLVLYFLFESASGTSCTMMGGYQCPKT